MSNLDSLDAQARDMVGAQVPQQPKTSHGLYVEFYNNAVQDKEKSLEEGRPIFVEQPYIQIMVPGDKDSIVRRPIRTGMNPKDDNNRFNVEYNAFLNNLEQPLEGTPVEEWTQISKSQALELQALNIKTVEMLADLNDVQVSKFMGLADLKKRAASWIDLASKEAPIAYMQNELEERDNAILSLQNVLEEMQGELAELKGVKKKAK
jgi:hypothetical protein